jgi:hypothetical protein
MVDGQINVYNGSVVRYFILYDQRNEKVGEFR